MGTPPSFPPLPPKRSQRSKPTPTQAYGALMGTTTTHTTYYSDAHTIKVPYKRHRVRPFIEGEGEWYVTFSPYWGSSSFKNALTWEHWCQALSRDGDIEEALRLLRSTGKNSHRLWQSSPGIHWLVFSSKEMAEAVGQVWSQAVGKADV